MRAGRALREGGPGPVKEEALHARARRLLDRAESASVRLATAESCTGGLLAGIITGVPGASASFAGGLVAYANEIKIRHLGVPARVLEAQGAVSEAVALRMAHGARQSFGAGLAMAVTGIAGPSGGTPEKPAGTVWIAVALKPGREVARCERFGGGRAQVRRASVAAALDLALEMLAR